MQVFDPTSPNYGVIMEWYEAAISSIVIDEAAKKIDANTSIVINELYPLVDKRLSTPSGKKAYHACISKFIEDRYGNLYDNLPCARIFFGADDANQLFSAMEIPESAINNLIEKTYYGDEPNFSPKAAKDAFTILILTIIRFFVSKNMTKETELAVIHMAFSGKFYPSLHYRSYPTTVPARHVMEYTVNNVLTTKFDLVSEGSVIGAIKKIGMTWLNTYRPRFKTFKDEDAVYLIQQLYSRIGSFMKNVATEYYKCYNEKDDLYIAYASDSMDPEDYHMADSDTLRIAKQVEKSMNYINGNGVNYAICKQCSDDNITTKEITSIIESILGDPENVIRVKELITLLITTYYAVSKTKDVRDISFITYSIAAKPNTKQKELLRIKQITEELLSENSPAYTRRKSRTATKNSFERAVIMYFTLSIHNANR